MKTPRPGDQELSGMTVNERLAACGIIDKWDAAVRSKNRDAMLALLRSIAMTEIQAAQTADAVLKNPGMYGF